MGAHLTSPIRGELGYAHRPQLGSQIYCPIYWNQIRVPLPYYGKKIFALTVNKFVFSHSGNFRPIVLYCIVSIHLYSASCSAHQSEALPVRETQREESSLERTKRGTWL